MGLSVRYLLMNIVFATYDLLHLRTVYIFNMTVCISVRSTTNRGMQLVASRKMHREDPSLGMLVHQKVLASYQPQGGGYLVVSKTRLHELESV